MLDPHLDQYYLPDNTTINHKYKSFINHVLKQINNIDYDSTEGQSITANIQVDTINDELTNTGHLLIPIGIVCLEFSKGLYDTEVERGVYGMIVENLIWELVTVRFN